MPAKREQHTIDSLRHGSAVTTCMHVTAVQTAHLLEQHSPQAHKPAWLHQHITTRSQEVHVLPAAYDVVWKGILALPSYLSVLLPML
jgi:hypothetical protein